MKKSLITLATLNLFAVSTLGVSTAFADKDGEEKQVDISLVESLTNTSSEQISKTLDDIDLEESKQEFNPNVYEETEEAIMSAEMENDLAQSQAPQIIGGTAYFSDYGIEDDSVPADAAFEEMISNPKVTKIVSTSNLWFQKRHTITRDNLEIDFGNYKIKNGDMEDAASNDPFAAVLIFKGDNQGEIQQVTLKEDMKLYQEIFEVEDSSEFELYEYYRVHVNARPGEVGIVGKQEKEIDKMIMVTEIVDETHVKFNYRMGWEIEAGRVMTYDKVEPVRNVTVKNAKYYNTGEGELDSASLVSFEYVVEGNVSDIESYHTYWPAIMRRHNTHYYTIRTKLYNPIEVVVGGTGYLTQQIHTLYGTVKDNQTSAARHLNDFTGSAYCVVENNHATNDYHGGFVTHGQFEHDLTYINNTGLLSFANSGLTWGESARRISVKKHYGSWVIARTKITDLTLEDVEVHAEDYYPDSGKFLINADGAQLKGVTGDEVIFTQRSDRSRRPTSIEGSSFKKENIIITKEGQNAVTSEIILKDFPAEEKARLTTKYVDEKGKELKSPTKEEILIGEEYQIKAPNIEGYTVVGSKEIKGTMVKDGKTEVFTYKKNQVPQGPYISYGKYVTVTSKAYNTWSNFGWKEKLSSQQIAGNTYYAKGKYEHQNGQTYLSLYNDKDVWQGYINQKATKQGSGKQGAYISDGRYVTITSKSYNTWSNFSWKKRTTAAQITGKTFLSKGKYKHMNGETYLSLYNDKNVWQGYINQKATKQGSGKQGAYISDGRQIVVTKKGYNTWQNFSWKKKYSTNNLVGKEFTARGRYNHINGSTYYSLFDKKGVWQGYLNTTATKLK